MSLLEILAVIAQLSVPVLAVIAAYIKLRERLVRLETQNTAIVEMMKLDRERMQELERVAREIGRRAGLPRH